MHILYILVKDILPSLKCICIYNFSGIIQSVISKSEHFFICVICGKSSTFILEDVNKISAKKRSHGHNAQKNNKTNKQPNKKRIM